MKQRKFHLHLTLFGTLVLALVLVLLFQTLKGRAEPIFDDNTTTTYYAKTVLGTAPDLKAERYFNKETYDLSGFTFDISQCDWNIAGTYRVPVMYDGKKTNCVVQVEVRASGEDITETASDINENAVLREQ
ncbi:ty transcription activator TEC1 [Clostridium boliviensis]|uniref:Ty transcription activator TEC1 n=1 Tax=Clostridium boliviensis TaxID=318465 RepID=A0ABU4GIK4_9CLOT|nr:ty transcription activator TEC1 [Clostridium boliviensis]MDW2797441.1 ty transcription activator TEC1 [Clostridium boliviensis]